MCRPPASDRSLCNAVSTKVPPVFGMWMYTNLSVMTTCQRSASTESRARPRHLIHRVARRRTALPASESASFNAIPA